MTRRTDERSERDVDGDGSIDALLSDHFAAALDGQVGRAGRAFERHIAAVADEADGEGPAAATTRLVRPVRASARRGWVIATLGTGLAASVAALFTVSVMRNNGQVPVASGSAEDMAPSVAGHLGVPEKPPAVDVPADVSSTATATVVTLEPQFHFRKVDEVLSRYAQIEGLVVIDDHTPARIVRERAVERTRWVDERRGLRIETVVPREDVKLIHLETH
jgi:hypothetical protein